MLKTSNDIFNRHFSSLFFTGCRATIPSDPDLEAAVERTLSKMSLDEKIGQMTELSIDVLGDWKDGEVLPRPSEASRGLLPCIRSALC